MPINFYTHIKGRIPNGKELTKKKKKREKPSGSSVKQSTLTLALLITTNVLVDMCLDYI